MWLNSWYWVCGRGDKNGTVRALPPSALLSRFPGSADRLKSLSAHGWGVSYCEQRIRNSGRHQACVTNQQEPDLRGVRTCASAYVTSSGLIHQRCTTHTQHMRVCVRAVKLHLGIYSNTCRIPHSPHHERGSSPGRDPLPVTLQLNTGQASK